MKSRQSNNQLVSRSTRIFVGILIGFSAVNVGKLRAGEKPDTYAALHRSLVTYAAANGGKAPLTSEYSVAIAQLDGAGAKEAVVIFTGSHYRGSSGCSMKVLRRLKTGSYGVVSNLTLCRKNGIWVSPKTHKGWNDLVIHVSGGGAVAGKRLLTYNGNSYPRNPSTQPGFEGADEKLRKIVFTPVPAPTGSEQDGADQPATAQESKSEGKDKPKPESDVRSQ